MNPITIVHSVYNYILDIFNCFENKV